MQDFRDNTKKELVGITGRLAGEIALLHSSRATPALVEHITVSAYGQKLPLNQVASLSTPDARTILVQPWDSSILAEIQKAIEASSVSLGVVPDEKFIRLTMPQLSEERRGEIVKALGKKIEEARISVRKVRDRVSKSFEEAFRAKEISEDEKFRSKEALQKIIDECIGAIRAMEEKKSKEILGL